MTCLQSFELDVDERISLDEDAPDPNLKALRQLLHEWDALGVYP